MSTTFLDPLGFSLRTSNILLSALHGKSNVDEGNGPLNWLAGACLTMAVVTKIGRLPYGGCGDRDSLTVVMKTVIGRWQVPRGPLRGLKP